MTPMFCQPEQVPASGHYLRAQEDVESKVPPMWEPDTLREGAAQLRAL
jgi:hypothetical protein